MSDQNLSVTVAAEIKARSGEVANLAADMVRFDSVSPKFRNEGPIQTWLARYLAGLGAEVDVWDVACDPQGEELESSRPNVVATWRGNGPGKSLLINGHVDVVPVDLDGWTHNPFEGAIDDGYVWGRGSVDTKGGIAAAIFAIEVLLEFGWRPSGTLALHAVMGEESGEGGTYAAIERGHRADAAIVLEPTELAVKPLEGGFQLLTIEVNGTAGHACDRWRLNSGSSRASAVDKGLVVVSALQSLDERWRATKSHKAFPAGWANLGVNVIRSGSTFGSIPADFLAECAIWYLPGETSEGIREEVEGVISEACFGDPWFEDNPPKVNWGLDYPPAVTPVDQPIVQTFLTALAAVGLEPSSTAFLAVSDLRWITAHHGIPGVLFGPGSLAQAHAVDERVAIEELVHAACAFAYAIPLWFSQV